MAQELNFLRNSMIFHKTQSKNYQNSICRCFRELKISTHILAVQKESISSLNKLDWDMQSFTQFKTKSETQKNQRKLSAYFQKTQSERLKLNLPRYLYLLMYQKSALKTSLPSTSSSSPVNDGPFFFERTKSSTGSTFFRSVHRRRFRSIFGSRLGRN